MRRSAVAALLALPLAGACELTEVTVAQPEDLVVAEVVLRAGASRQAALLHRTLPGSPLVQGARIEVAGPGDEVIRYEETGPATCLDLGEGTQTGTCYASAEDAPQVRAGTRYTLRIELPGGGVLTATTTVPGLFEIVTPTPSVCRIGAGEQVDIVWTRSGDAWVYVAETHLFGVRAAFEPAGIEVPEDPLRLIGLAITADDTTIAFPGEFGVFDRFDDELHAILVEIRNGLPAGVRGEVSIAAAERNYVNWVRGGDFNPSGIVQVPSVFGVAGTGVFGALVEQRVELDTTDPLLPVCGD